MSQEDFHKAWVAILCLKCAQMQKEMVPDKTKPAKYMKIITGRFSISYPTEYHPTGLCYYCRKKKEGLL